MTTETDMEQEQDAGEPRAAHVLAQEAQKALRGKARELSRAATALGPLTKEKTFEDPGKAAEVLAKVSARMPESLRETEGALAVLGQIQGLLDDRVRRARDQLAVDLKKACDARGLEILVISRDEPLVLRLPPLEVTIDRHKGTAVIAFAKEALLQVPAEAEAVVEAHEKALKSLDTRFDPGAFLERCFRAWKASSAIHGEAGGRVEIVDFLPYLALQQQRPTFRKNPTKKAFTDYTRAQFAWDVLRLRRQRVLVHKGYRLNLGVATGTSASRKGRVIFFEDEYGTGEFKLTVFFTKEEA